MLNGLLYLSVLLVWGGSWLAIKWQDGPVLTALSILYRFGLSALLLLVIALLLGKLQSTNRRDQLFCLLQGLCLFSFNFIAFYLATHHIASGLVAVIMSTATIFNAAHNRLIWKTRASGHFKLGAALGVGGLLLLFWNDLVGQQWSAGSLTGIGYALLGTWLFSLGNMIGVRHVRRGLQAYTGNLWAMLYGCLVLLLISGVFFAVDARSWAAITLWDDSPRYLAALVYLALFASVWGFTAYLMLVARIGANHAAYTLVVTPVVALSLSSLFESYQWSGTAVGGLVVIIAGNLCVLGGSDRFKGRWPTVIKRRRFEA